MFGVFKNNVTWINVAQFRKRKYKSYEEYLEHQASKLGTIKGMDGYNVKFREALKERLKLNPKLVNGTSVLCLGARTGAECQAFIELGCVAIGVDLNPGEKNKYVVTGDFHDLQFADGSFDCVFTNALDHCYDIDRVVGESARILKGGGLLMVEIVRGSKDEGGREPGDFESVWWDSVEEPIQAIRAKGFEVWERAMFTYPWTGDHIIFVKS